MHRVKLWLARRQPQAHSAATTCQHESRCAGWAITDAIDHHVQTERDNDNGSAALLAPAA
jgi:hypothetical protein